MDNLYKYLLESMDVENINRKVAQMINDAISDEDASEYVEIRREGPGYANWILLNDAFGAVLPTGGTNLMLWDGDIQLIGLCLDNAMQEFLEREPFVGILGIDCRLPGGKLDRLFSFFFQNFEGDEPLGEDAFLRIFTDLNVSFDSASSVIVANECGLLAAPTVDLLYAMPTPFPAMLYRLKTNTSADIELFLTVMTTAEKTATINTTVLRCVAEGLTEAANCVNHVEFDMTALQRFLENNPEKE